MYDRMQTFDQTQLTKLHDASLELLAEMGVAFNEPEAIDIFKAHGFKVEGTVVRFGEGDVAKALETAPNKFTIVARNEENNLTIGGDDYVLAPGYGAPFVVTPEGEQRQATMDDYETFCKLVQTSPVINMNGFMMVEPHDLPPQTVHLDMLRANLLLSDKPFMGSPVSKAGARDCVDLLKVVWGEAAAERVHTVSLCNSLSPLQFSDEMAGSLIELARAGQACVVAALIMAGSSGPVTLPGVLVVQNAEILAGLTLAQLVRPGAPVIYGSTSSAMDMRTGGLSIGAPELSQLISATAQMARFYNLPCRSGGALTDAHTPGAQAAAESILSLSTAVRTGVNFILHAAGILGAYIAMSPEKFIIDEEAAAMLAKLIKPMVVDDESVDLDMIKRVGPGGQYLTQPKTFRLCRTEFFLPRLHGRDNYAGWKAAGSPELLDIATKKLGERLAAYEPPTIDQGLVEEIDGLLARKKADIQ